MLLRNGRISKILTFATAKIWLLLLLTIVVTVPGRPVHGQAPAPTPQNQQVRLPDLARLASGFILEESIPNMTDVIIGEVNTRLIGPGTYPGSAKGFQVQFAGLTNVAASPGGQTRRTNAPSRKNMPWNIWAAGRFTMIDNQETGFNFEADLVNSFGGADYLWLDGRLITGVFVGYEWFEVDSTVFPGMFMDGRGVTVGTYVGFRILPFLTADAQFGYTFLDYDISNGLASGSFDASRWFVAVNLTGHFKVAGIQIRPRGGFFYVSEDQDSYTDSLGTANASQTLFIGRLRFGVEVAKKFPIGGSNQIEPFVGMLGEYDFAKFGNIIVVGRTTSPGRLGARVTGGVRLFLGPHVLVRISGSYVGIGRKDYSAWNAGGKISFRY